MISWHKVHGCCKPTFCATAKFLKTVKAQSSYRCTWLYASPIVLHTLQISPPKNVYFTHHSQNKPIQFSDWRELLPVRIGVPFPVVVSWKMVSVSLTTGSIGSKMSCCSSISSWYVWHNPTFCMFDICHHCQLSFTSLWHVKDAKWNGQVTGQVSEIILSTWFQALCQGHRILWND